MSVPVHIYHWDDSLCNKTVYSLFRHSLALASGSDPDLTREAKCAPSFGCRSILIDMFHSQRRIGPGIESP